MTSKPRLIVLLVGLAAATNASAQSSRDTFADVRRPLDIAYRENADAFARGDVAAVMALRAANVHTITPDGLTQDRRAMELYVTGFMNGIREWNQQIVATLKLTPGRAARRADRRDSNATPERMHRRALSR